MATVADAVNPQASTSAGIGVTTVSLVAVPIDGVDEAPSVTSGTVNETSSNVAQQLSAVSRGTKRSADAPTDPIIVSTESFYGKVHSSKRQRRTPKRYQN